MPKKTEPKDTQSTQPEQVQQVRISDIHPFKNHPFKVVDDALMLPIKDATIAPHNAILIPLFFMSYLSFTFLGESPLITVWELLI